MQTGTSCLMSLFPFLDFHKKGGFLKNSVYFPGMHILSTSENPTLHSVGWSLSGFDAVLSRPAFNSLFYRDQLHIILYVPSIGIWQITVLEVALFHWFPPSSTNVVECPSFLSITGLLRVLFLLCGSVIFMSVFSLSLAFVIIQNLVWITGKQMVSSN